MIIDCPVLANDSSLGLIIQLPNEQRAIVKPEGWPGVEPGEMLRVDYQEILGSYRLKFL